MDMIGRQRSSHDHYLTRLASLPDQIARTLGDSPSQYLVTVFFDPDPVILYVVDRVRAMSVFRRPLILVEGGWKLTA